MNLSARSRVETEQAPPRNGYVLEGIFVFTRIHRCSPLTRIAVAVTLLAGLPSATLAQYEFEAEDHSAARLTSTTTALIAGQTNTLALVFTIDHDWHVYWDGQNDTGMAVSLDLKTPEGWPQDWTAGPLVEPVPVRHIANGDLLDHVLEGSPVMLFSVDVPEAAAGTTVTILGEASWLVCREACMLDDEGLELRLPVVGPGETAMPSADAGLLGEAAEALPSPADKPVDWASWEWADGRLVIRAEAKGTLEFYPSANSIPIADLVESGTTTSGELRLGLGAAASERRATIRGVVALRGKNGSVRSFWLDETPPN